MLSVENRLNWTLTMALAWIASRDMEAVEEAADTCATAVRWMTGDDTDAAERALRSKLQSGEIVCRAVERVSLSSVQVPADEWAHLVWWDENGADVLAKRGRFGLEAVYEQPKILSADIERLWPTPPPPAMKHTSKQEQDCKRWLAGIIAKSPNRMTTTKAKFMVDAADGAGVGEMSERALERVWDDCVKEYPAWRRVGRPPNKPRTPEK